MKAKLDPFCGKLTPKTSDAELRSQSSPSFSYGRTADGLPLSAGMWLFRTGQIPSNITGVTVNYNQAVIQKILVGCKFAATFTIGIYTHEGNETNLTLLDTYIVNNDNTFTFNPNEPVPEGIQVGVKIESITAGSLEDLGVDLSMAGGI